VVRITADDVKPMVDQMIELLRRRDERSRPRRIADWFQGDSHRDHDWRAQSLTFFSDLRRRLDDPAERFSDEAAHLFRWLDWDAELERQPAEIRALTPRIQQALGLLERSRDTAPEKE
jgi:hypothetical protein